MRQKAFLGKLLKKLRAKMEQQNYVGVQQLPIAPVGYDERIQYNSGGLNKVSSKQGYVPNEYTGRSKMTYGGMERKKAAMGMSKMDEDMMGSMRSQMMMGGKREGMMYGGRAMKGQGGKMKGGSDIYAMESACNKMAGYNKSLPSKR